MRLGVNTSYIQIDNTYPTGTVDVYFDKANQPNYIINKEVAWDFLRWNDDNSNIFKSADAICFGTIAQRHDITRKTILKILAECNKSSLKVLDINLRQDFYNKQIIEESLKLSDILKLNDSELKVIVKILKKNDPDTEEDSCLYLLKKYALRLVCLTKGDQGSILFDEKSIYRQDAYPCKVTDTVGAGDAFTAAMIIQYLEGSTLKTISEMANKLASWTASKKGAMPDYDNTDFQMI